MTDPRFGLKLPLATPHVRQIEDLQKHASVMVAIGVTTQPPRPPVSRSERKALLRAALGTPKGR